MNQLLIWYLTTYHRATSGAPDARRREGGSVTTEHVLWAVAVIAIVALVVAAVRTYVETQAGSLR